MVEMEEDIIIKLDLLLVLLVLLEVLIMDVDQPMDKLEKLVEQVVIGDQREVIQIIQEVVEQQEKHFLDLDIVLLDQLDQEMLEDLFLLGK
jgi:hypothetical protein